MANPNYIDFDQYSAEEATHEIICHHFKEEYRMKCTPAKDMGNGKIKIVVFGDRHHPGREFIKKTRYVKPERIVEI